MVLKNEGWNFTLLTSAKCFLEGVQEPSFKLLYTPKYCQITAKILLNYCQLF